MCVCVLCLQAFAKHQIVTFGDQSVMMVNGDYTAITHLIQEAAYGTSRSFSFTIL